MAVCSGFSDGPPGRQFFLAPLLFFLSSSFLFSLLSFTLWTSMVSIFGIEYLEVIVTHVTWPVSYFVFLCPLRGLSE